MTPFKRFKKRKFENSLKELGLGNIDVDNMICDKCGKKITGSWSPIGNGKVRCSKCWDWL